MKIRNIQERFKTRLKAEKRIQKAIKIAEENIKAKRAAELERQEAETNAIVKRVAKSMFDPMKRVIVTKTGDVAEFSIKDMALKNEGTLSISDSIWAPWSINFKG